MKRTAPFLTFFYLPFSIFCFAAVSATAPDVSPRLFLADAHLSATLPDPWDLKEPPEKLVYFERATAESRTATIRFEIAAQTNPDRLSEEMPLETLQEFARRDIASRDPQTRILASEIRTLIGRNAFEATWQEGGQTDEGEMTQSVYLYIHDRFVIVLMRASRADFPTLVPEYQAWLLTLRALSLRDSGALDTPSRGGLYIHLASRVRVPVPDTWLVGVANDHSFGAAIVDGEKNVRWSMTLLPRRATGEELTSAFRKDAKSSLTKQGLRILQESENPFHGYTALALTFDGNKNQRFIKGQDLWVWSPTAQWLISIEGDGPLMNRLRGDYGKMLDAIQFL